jgi:ABC-2 type transport system ATP-binding protein
LTVARGEIFGLLGPNGAGKTTLLRLLLGFLRPTSGRATIRGLDCYRQSVEVRKLVSYLPGDARLFRQMRGRDILRFFADIRTGCNFERSLQFAERLELDLSRRVSVMSTGMRQKAALAATLAADSALLILDEPTSNLDPTIRAVVAKMVCEARDNGQTVIFSSHVLSEVEEVCDRVVILRAGRLVHTQVMSALRSQHRIRARFKGQLPEIPHALRERLNVVTNSNGELCMETGERLAPLLSWLSNLAVEEINIAPVGLRAIYDRFHG